METMEAVLREEFSKIDFNVEEDSVAEQCVAMCTSFGMKPVDLVSNWELFYLNRQLEGGTVSSSRMAGFKQFLVEEQKAALRQKQTSSGFHSTASGFHSYHDSAMDIVLDDNEDDPVDQITPTRLLAATSKRVKVPGTGLDSPFEADLALVAPKTPAAAHKTVGEAPRPKITDSPVTPFSRRLNKCTVQLAFNDDLRELEDDRVVPGDSEDDVLRRLPPIEWCQVEVLSTNPKSGCRFMYDRVENRFLSIERRIRSFAEALSAWEQCRVSQNVAVASQDQVKVVGRICCDGEGHLNDKSVLLEGSVEFSGGQRVRLDLRNILQFSLFPGQVVGVEGHNPSGYCLVASRLIDAVPPSLAQDSEEQVGPPPKRQEWALPESEKMDTSDVPLQITIVTAAGPYCASDNLLFEPLVELFSSARRKRPRLLILMGPFVDSEHPLIKSGLVDRTFKQIFQEEVATRVVEYCQEMGDGARVLLIPSCRDAHHDNVFPQPPFTTEGFDFMDDQVSVLANPCIIRCDEVTIGCCTMDVLRHLSSEEMSRCPAGVASDRMGRVASHILAQRSFYPLFPPPAGTPLDLSLTPEALVIPEIPNFLLIPSDLAPFAKVLSISHSTESESGHKGDSSSLCINPGRLTKGLSGGTFSEILILPESKSAPDDSASKSSSDVSSRTKVVIQRI